MTKQKHNRPPTVALGSIIDTLQDGIISLDANLCYTYANPAALSYWGVDVTKILGRRVDEINPAVAPALLQAFQSTLDSGEDRKIELIDERGITWRVHIQPSEGGLTAAFCLISAPIEHVNSVEKRGELLQRNANILFEISSYLLNNESLQDGLAEICEVLSSKLDYDRVTIFLVDPDAKAVTGIYKGGPGQNFIEAIDYDELQKGLTGWALREGKPALSPKGLPDERENPDVQARRERTNAGSILVVPVILQGKLTGTITSILTPKQRDHDETDLQLLQSLAAQVATAIHNNQLYDSLRQEILTRRRAEEELELNQRELDTKVLQRTQALAMISECNQLIVQAKDELELLAEICRVAVKTGGYLFAWVGLVTEDDAKTISPVASAGFDPDYLKGIPFTYAATKYGQGATGTCVRENRPVVMEDLQTRPHPHNWLQDSRQRGYQAIVAVPIRAGERILGALTLYSSQANGYTPEELADLQALAGNISIGIRTVRSQAALARSETRFRTSFDNTPAAVAIVRVADLKVVDANRSFLKWFDMTREQVMENPLGTDGLFGQSEGLELFLNAIRKAKALDELPITTQRPGFGVSKVLVSSKPIDLEEVPHALISLMDITPQVSATDAMNIAQRLARIGSWEFEIDTKKSNWSDNLYRIYNYPVGSEPPTLDELSQRIHPDDRVTVRAAIEKTSKEGLTLRNSYRYFPNPGQPNMIYIEGISSAIMEQDGSHLRTTGTVQDVTDRKLAELKLLDAQQQLNLAQALSHIGSWQVDLDTGSFTGSSEAMSVLGLDGSGGNYTWQEILTLIDPSLRDQTEAIFTNAFKTGELIDNILQVNTQYGQRWVHILGQLESDANLKIERVVGSIQDITERKAFEAALNESESRFKTFIDFSPIGASLTDENGIIIEWNKALEKMLQLPREKVLGMPVWQIYDLMPEQGIDLSEIKKLSHQVIEEALKNGFLNPLSADRLDKVILADGNERIIRRNMFMIETGKGYRIGTAYQDVTRTSQDQAVLSMRLAFTEFANEHSFDELFSFALDQVENLLGSEMSFCTMVNDGLVLNKQAIFSSKARKLSENMNEDLKDVFLRDGPIWSDVVHKGAHVLLNDLTKKQKADQFPYGHPQFTRMMLLPIRRSGKTIGIAGLCNKKLPFTHQDAELVSDYFEMVWEVISHKSSQQESQRLSGLVETAIDLVGTLLPDCSFSYINSAGRQMLGLSLDAAVSEYNLYNFLQQQSSDTMKNVILPEVMVKGRWIGELQFHNLSGQPFAALLNIVASSTSEGNIKEYFFILNDITVLKEAEQSLRNSEQRLASLLNAIPDMIFRQNSEGVYLDFKGDATRAYVPPEVFIGKKMDDVLPTDLVGRFRAVFKAALESGSLQTMEYSMKLNGGEEFFEARMEPNLATGELTTIVRDISQRKRYEKELELYRESLETLVDQRTRELQTARDIADDANKAKSDFLAVMSHEIRTPLNGVLGLASLALQTNLDEQQRNYIEHIRTSGETLLAIINEILDFSKIEAGKLLIEKIDFDLDEVLHGFGDMLGFNAAEKGLEFVFDVQSDVPRMLQGDPGRLRQVLLNITNNAVKFTNQGQVVLKVQVVERSKKGVLLQFTVTDTGIGMTEQQVTNLFQPFMQADSTTTRKFGGTGLGLVVSQRIVELLGGQITVESTFGEGSSFTFSVPFEYSITKPQVKLTIESELRGQLLWLVDDSPASLNALAAVVRSLQFETRTFGSINDLEEALLNAAPEELPQMILLDDSLHQAPDLANLRAKLPQNCKLLLMGQPDSSSSSWSAASAGLDGVIVKPFTASSIFDAIITAYGRGSGSRNFRARQTQLVQMQPELMGRSVLLVEDNEINQLVGRELLERLGLRVEIAKNGVEAVESVIRSRYDLVLMDIQMPLMDGYEATRQIRALQQGKSASPSYIPIVAMTAHAMASEREKALAIGMNDYLTKPIDISAMVQALGRYVGKRRTGALLAPPKLATPQVAADPVPAEPEVPLLDTAGALGRLGDDQALYTKILGMFLNEHAADGQKLSALIENGYREDAHRLAHSIKGTAASLGGMRLSAAAQVLEKMLASGSSNTTAAEQHDALDKLDRELSALLQKIKQTI